jgi:replicative DNA helicase
MTARELRNKAAELRRTARLVSDDDIARALIELAEHYEALADDSASEKTED